MSDGQSYGYSFINERTKPKYARKVKICYGQLASNMFLQTDPEIYDIKAVSHPDGSAILIYHYYKKEE